MLFSAFAAFCRTRHDRQTTQWGCHTNLRAACGRTVTILLNEQLDMNGDIILCAHCSLSAADQLDPSVQCSV